LIEEPCVLARSLALDGRVKVSSDDRNTTSLSVVHTLPIQRCPKVLLNSFPVNLEQIKGLLRGRMGNKDLGAQPAITKAG
jgi:hypothetical protein